MPWHYTKPEAFPRKWLEAHESATASPLLLEVHPTKAKAKTAAAEFRRFRWCLRETPTARAAIAREAALTYRITVKPYYTSYALFLSAKPSLFLTLSSSLAENPT